MYPPIVCTCGNSLGELHRIYSEEKERRLKEYLKKNGETDEYLENLILSTETTVEMGDFLDRLGLELICCRTKLLTGVFMKQYFE